MEPVRPPIEPMLAKLAAELPAEGGMLYEPKWDGFRALVFKTGNELLLQAGICGRSSDISRICTTPCAPVCRKAVCSTGKSSLRRRTGSISTRSNCGFTPRRRASRSSPRRPPRRLWRSTCSPAAEKT